MGFWDKVKSVVLGDKEREARTVVAPIQPQTRPRIDMMEYKSFDLGQRFEQIFTAIKLGFIDMKETTTARDNHILARLDTLVAAQQETKTMLEARLESLETYIAGLKPTERENVRVKTNEVLECIENYGEISLMDLTREFKSKPNTLSYHLTKLLTENKIRKVREGLYKTNRPLSSNDNEKKTKMALIRLSRKKGASYRF